MGISRHRAVWVHFFEPRDGKNDYFFGSIKAIYSRFNTAEVGLTMKSLYAKGLKADHHVVTDKCRITRVEIARCSHDPDCQCQKEEDQ